jgi:hypothetical protein
VAVDIEAAEVGVAVAAEDSEEEAAAVVGVAKLAAAR